ncbi:MAG: hypothetical protein JSR17_12330 [Proteobacteria bacterium]|nr:hypothetical protein [Pseudomonadota bacterium]
MATKFHIAKRLIDLGWQELPHENGALFKDANLELNDEISKHLEYKHLLAQIVQQNCKDIMPLTYYVNDQNYNEVLAKIIFENYMVNNRYEKNIENLKWILKPSMLNNGDNICLFNNVEELKKHFAKTDRLGGDHVIQQYIPNPDLVDGRKYTFRVSGVITNYAGVYLYKQGYINISAFPFNLSDGFHNRKVHITNYVLDGEFANIEQRSTQLIENFDKIYGQMCDIVKRVLTGLLKTFPAYLKPQALKKFEIFGFDFMLDNTGKLWLIEINQAPDAPTFEENKLDDILWKPFWQDIIDEFVIPIALGDKAPRNYAHYQRILSANECYSWFREIFYNLKNRIK